jgi:hypothetical protein
MPEQIDEAPRRPQRQENEAQQGRLTGARRPGQELERLPLDGETNILEDLSAHPIAKANIFESDHGGPLPVDSKI